MYRIGWISGIRLAILSRLLLLNIVVFLPYWVGKQVIISRSSASVGYAKRVKDILFEYENIRATVYGSSGQVDYRLKAHKLSAQQLSSDLIVEQPVVHFSQRQSTSPSLVKRSNIKQPIDYFIQASCGVLSQKEINFRDKVSLLYKFPEKDTVLHGKIHANNFFYNIQTGAFEASGQVWCMHGAQQIQAERIHGHLDADDYYFEHAKVIYRKQ